MRLSHALASFAPIKTLNLAIAGTFRGWENGRTEIEVVDSTSLHSARLEHMLKQAAETIEEVEGIYTASEWKVPELHVVRFLNDEKVGRERYESLSHFGKQPPSWMLGRFGPLRGDVSV